MTKRPILKCVVNNEKKGNKSLNHQQLIEKIERTNGSYMDREQVVLQNLRDMGF